MGTMARSRRRTNCFRHLTATARRLWRDEGGTALVEFTLVFPVLIALFLGLVEFGEVFSVNRKVTNAAATVSDLVSQVPSVTDADLADISAVATELLKPYPSASFGMVISSIVANSENSAATVAWSYSTGTGVTARTQGTAYTLPAGLTEPGSSVIMVETFYNFTPTVGLYLTGTHKLQAQAYFRPRLTRVVAKN